MKIDSTRLSISIALLCAITLAVLYRDQFSAELLSQWLQQSGAAAPLVFIALYALATLLFFPGSVLTLAGGALFGPLWGTLYNLAGATLGATLSFMVARYIASDWVEQKTGGRFKMIKHGIESEGWRFVAFLRLVPLFPFNLLNYALGLTRIPWLHYTLASFIFMLPGAIAYTYLGFVGRETASGGSDLISQIMIAVALLGMVAFLPRLIARLRGKPMLSVDQLAQRLQQDDRLLLLDVRGAEDFNGCKRHLMTALNIPLEQLNTRIEDLLDYTEQSVAVICTTDRRSSKAAKMLTLAGFGDVHVVRGGMTAWQQAGFPLTMTPYDKNISDQ